MTCEQEEMGSTKQLKRKIGFTIHSDLIWPDFFIQENGLFKGAVKDESAMHVAPGRWCVIATILTAVTSYLFFCSFY